MPAIQHILTIDEPLPLRFALFTFRFTLSLCLCFLRFCLKGAKSLGMQRPKESRVSLDPVSLLCGLFGSVSFTFVQFRFVHL